MKLVFQKRPVVRMGRSVTTPFAVYAKDGSALRFNTVATKIMLEKHVQNVEMAIDADEPKARTIYLKLLRPTDKSVFDQSFKLNLNKAKGKVLEAPSSVISGKGLLKSCGFASGDKFNFEVINYKGSDFAKLTRV